MKKLLALFGVAALLFAVSCTKKDDPEEDNQQTLEVTAENLSGTWEQFIEHDFAQGYQQKYRVKFEGQNYTLWHMHQEVKTIDGEHFGLVCVGDKCTGTWEFVSGKLSFTHKTWKASSFISSMSPLSYTYYVYNVETMESTPWYESPDYIVSTLDKTEWPVISLTKGALTVKINMDTFALAKQ